jgi:hypothetical protein
MHGRRFDRILTGTAIALILGLASAPAIAQTSQNSPDNAAIEALVPLPEPANMPPPSAADVDGPVTGTTTPSAVNLPDPPDLPPPTFKDVAAPAVTAPATTAAPAPAVAPAPAPVVANAEQPVMDALRDL